jgi:hypothetical protein
MTRLRRRLTITLAQPPADPRRPGSRRRATGLRRLSAAERCEHRPPGPGGRRSGRGMRSRKAVLGGPRSRGSRAAEGRPEGSAAWWSCVGLYIEAVAALVLRTGTRGLGPPRPEREWAVGSAPSGGTPASGNESAESAGPGGRLRSEKRARRLRRAHRAAGTARTAGCGALSWPGGGESYAQGKGLVGQGGA